MSEKQDIRDARQFITPHKNNKCISKKASQIIEQVALRDTSNILISNMANDQIVKKTSLVRQQIMMDSDGGTEMLLRIHPPNERIQQKEQKENIEISYNSNKQYKLHRIKLQPIIYPLSNKDSSFSKSNQQISNTNQNTTEKISKFIEPWTTHILQHNGSFGKPDQYYQMFAGPSTAPLCQATKKWKLFGDEFILTCNAANQNVSGIMYKNLMGSRFTLFVQNKLSAIIDYDCTCTAKIPKRLRGLEVRTFKGDYLDGEQIKLIAQEPTWNPIKDAYTLNFGGRAKIGSINNFILKSENNNTRAVLFGKMSKNTYSLDIKPPLSQIQAFAIGISSVTYKLGTM